MLSHMVGICTYRPRGCLANAAKEGINNKARRMTL